MLERYCKIEHGEFVFRIPIDALIFGALNSEYAQRLAFDEDGSYRDDFWQVTHKELFVRDLIGSLTYEEENGSSILSDALDQAFEHLNEYSFSDGLRTKDD